MTIEQIIQEVRTVKSVTRRQVFRYFKACKIQPLGARQRPQQYPADAASRIKLHLGFGDAPIVTLPELREVRRRALAARRANGHRKAAK